MYIICAIIYFEQRNGGNFSMGEKKEALLHDADVETAVFNYLLENKLLLMSVDPGYDGFKIYINGHNYLSKSLVIKTGETDEFERIERPTIKDGTFVQMRDFNSGKIVQYMTGQNARAALTDGTASDVSDFYTDADRFSTPQFRASFYSAVIRALWLYATEDNEVGFTIEDLTNNLSGWGIYLLVTLPYAYAQEAKKNIRVLLDAPIDAEFTLSRKMTVKLTSKLPIVKAYFQPQVLAAFRGTFLSEFGDYSDDTEAEMLQKMPAILIDAGYHTCAMVTITNALEVLEGDPTVTEEIFSMEEFDKKTAKKLRTRYSKEAISDSELSLALVNDYCNGDRELFASTDNGSEPVDVASIREQVLQEEKARLIQYLNKKFGMKKMRSAFITGGTGGSIMFDYLSDVLKNWKNVKDVSLITGFNLNGEDIGSVYGVAYGGYKMLVGIVRANADKE